MVPLLTPAAAELARATEHTRTPCASDPEAWFPTPRDTEAVATAKEACSYCPLREICLQAGMTEPFGIWAGTTPEEREGMRQGIAA